MTQRRPPRRRRQDRFWVGLTVAAGDLLAAAAFVLAGAVAANGVPTPNVPRVLACLIVCALGGLGHLFARIAAAWLRIYKRQAGLTILVEDIEAANMRRLA